MPRQTSRPLPAAVLVAGGGAAGSLFRWVVSLAFPSDVSFLATMVVNVVGCFLLGFLLEYLNRRGPETARHQQIRLLLGTGLCGGFTTYSTFMLDTHRLTFSTPATVLGFGAGFSMGLVYLAASFLLGTLATLIGISLAARR